MSDISAFTGVLGKKLAAHLLRRATFSPTKPLIDEFALKTPEEALSQLLKFYPITNKPIEPSLNDTWVDTIPAPSGFKEADLRDYIVAWMIYNMHFDRSLRSKMIIFLHQNWMVNKEAIASHNLYDYLKLLEFYSFGSYKTLAKKMCRDNRMLTYLNGSQNTKANPNENYAREFLELFTIGKGPQTAEGNYTNYTEDDIKAAAKVLSGYQYELDNNKTDPDTGIRYCSVNPTKHSSANKTFSSCFGPGNITIKGTNTAEGMETELGQFVNMVFDQQETARNICRKLYRYFVHRTINEEIERDIISPMANALKNDNYNLNTAIRLLLQSRHFYGLDSSPSNGNVIGAMVKSPLELILQALNFFNISPFDYKDATPDTIWNYFYKASLHKTLLHNAGMNLFGTTSVAGYPPYYSGPLWDRNWFDSSTVTQRFYLGKCFLENRRHPFSKGLLCAQFDIVVWVRDHITDPSDGSAVVNALTDYLFPEPPDTSRRDYFLNEVLYGSLSGESWQIAWNDYISHGTLDVVKPRLEALFKAILYAQEYQLQ